MNGWINKYKPHLLYSSVDGHLGCFHILVIVNSAAMNFEVHVIFQINIFIFFFWYIYPRVELLDHMVILWCWRRLLRVSQTARRPNQSILKEISPEFIGRTDAEAETPILWPHDAKNWLIGKDPDAGKDWRWEEKGMPEDKMVGWHHWLNGHNFD